MRGFLLFVLGVVLVVVVTAIDSCRVVIHAAQYDPDRLTRSLVLLPNRATWLLTRDVPNGYRFCGSQDPDGTLRGCVTAAELREKAERERKRAHGKGLR